MREKDDKEDSLASIPGNESLQEPTLVETADSLLGTSIGRYAVLENVAKGGTATVYRALDNVLNREVAVKILHEHLGGKREVVTRFKNEAQVIASLRHPNILTVFDFLEHQGRAVLVVEFMPGVTLSTLVKSTKKIPEDYVLMIALEILQGLQAAHSKGITHRDIKPANILLHPELGVKISDFGLAKLVNADDGLTKEGIFVGTPSFSSPEQIEGKPLDQRSDLFSLGLTIYILSTRTHAFKQQGDSTTTVWFKIVKGKFDSVRDRNPDLSPELDRILNKSLEVDVNKRYQKASDMIVDIEALLRSRGLVPYHAQLRKFLEDPNQAIMVGRGEKPKFTKSQKLGALAIGGFVVLLWIAGFLFQQNTKPEAGVSKKIELQTGADGEPISAPMGELQKPLVQPSEQTERADPVEAKKDEPKIEEPKVEAPKVSGFDMKNLSAGIYKVKSGDASGAFEFETFENYRARIKLTKRPLIVSSSFGDVDLELNPWTQDLKLTWLAGPDAAIYRLEVASDRGFRNLLFSGTVPTKSMTLERAWDKTQAIFWRVSYLDEGRSVFLMDPIRRINLKITGQAPYLDLLVPQAGDTFKAKPIDVKAFAPSKVSMSCALVHKDKTMTKWIPAQRSSAYLTAKLNLKTNVESVLCMAKGADKRLNYFSIPITVLE